MNDKAKENYQQQMKDSDLIFGVVSLLDNMADARRMVVTCYVPEVAFSRSGISHALERLERHYAKRPLEKVRAYDPRVGDYIETDNPALILGRLMWDHWPRGQFEQPAWDTIEAMANYCDELVPVYDCKKCGGACKVPALMKHPEG